MEICVAPISGGFCTAQMAATMLLADCGYRPKISMGSSGGCVALWCASAGNWSRSGIEKVCGSLNSNVFIQSNPLTSAMPVGVLSYILGNAYVSNKHPERFMSKFVDETSIQRDEIWVAAINAETFRTGLFCNKKAKECIINGAEYNTRKYNTEELHYYAGDVKRISKSMIASCSIPFLLDTMVIDGSRYVDCGAKFASPLTLLQDELVGPKHIIYLSGHNIEAEVHNSNYNNIFDLFTSIPSMHTRGIITSDRGVACSLINASTSCAHYPIGVLSEVLSTRYKYTSTCIEIYPLQESGIDIFNFTSDQIRDKIAECMDLLAIRVWWSND